MEDKIIYQDENQIISLSGEFVDFMDSYYVQKIPLSKMAFNLLLRMVFRDAEMNKVDLEDIRVMASSKAIKLKYAQGICLTEQFLPLTPAFDILTSVEDWSIIDKDEIKDTIESFYTEDDTPIHCSFFITPLFQTNGYLYCKYEDKLLVVFFALPDNSERKE